MAISLQTSDGDAIEARKQADTVKALHARLRREIRSGCDREGVWSRLLADRESLEEYSRAMHQLATGPWTEGEGGRSGSRILWCTEAIKEYFSPEGALRKLLLKDLRRMNHSMPTLVSTPFPVCTEDKVAEVVEEFCTRRLSLLDVGSCYNPFQSYPQFQVTAIDIAPAHPSVLECDFLSVPIHDKTDHIPRAPSPLKQKILYAENYDIVVFSLLLSYLPLPQQRLKCCIRAHRLLRLHGLLLLITPDSSHQNKHAPMMKAWKFCIESIGFHRWKYFKDTHLHCVAFRKITAIQPDCEKLMQAPYQLYIPQDKHAIEVSSTDSDSSDINFLSHLPFFEQQ